MLRDQLLRQQHYQRLPQHDLSRKTLKWVHVYSGPAEKRPVDDGPDEVEGGCGMDEGAGVGVEAVENAALDGANARVIEDRRRTCCSDRAELINKIVGA
jgi:hypothetical protein